MSCVLTIIIVNWNTRKLLASCLTSIAAEVEKTASEIETLVVDNASSDDSVTEVRQSYPWVTIIENNRNVGFAHANNQAVARSRGRYCLLLNSDTILHSGVITTLLKFAEQHPQAGAVGARLLNGDGTLQVSVHPMLTPIRELWRLLFLDRILNLATYRQERWSLTEPRQVETIKGACVLLRRSALEQIGLLDDRYFMYTEEVDLCYRLAQAGWELWYVPTAVVTHFGEASSRQVAETMYLQLHRSKIQFYRKFGGPTRAALAKAVFLIAYVPRAIAGSLVGLFKAEWRPLARTWRKLVRALPGM